MDPTKFRNLRVPTVFVAATSTCSRSAAHGRHQRVPLRRPAVVFQHPLESRGLLLGRGGALHRSRPPYPALPVLHGVLLRKCLGLQRIQTLDGEFGGRIYEKCFS